MRNGLFFTEPRGASGSGSIPDNRQTLSDHGEAGANSQESESGSDGNRDESGGDSSKDSSDEERGEDSDSSSSNDVSGGTSIRELEYDENPLSANGAAVIPGDGSDNDLGNPVFESTPNRSGSSSQTTPTVACHVLVSKLYDSIKTSGAVIEMGTSAKATEVGTIEESEDLLIAAETNPRSGPAYDLRIFSILMSEYAVSQRLAFLCLDSMEMVMQSHEDCKPVVLIRYMPTYPIVQIMRSIMQCDSCIQRLKNCHVHVALMGSSFDIKASGKQRTQDEAVEIKVLQPTMAPSKMIPGNIFTGSETNFIKDLQEAVDEACQAAEALHVQRSLLESNRKLKRRQEQELRLSEAADRRRAERQRDDPSAEREEAGQEEDVTELDDYMDESSKRPRIEDDGDSSGTVTLNFRRD